ncbi:hypothetical protein T492DRAFT_1106717 [Pavlovales sp. CCMP2436]|nr:hypothetical protein T492DRAFT_1106717 [Pavlovales sp. CCMP2436]
MHRSKLYDGSSIRPDRPSVMTGQSDRTSTYVQAGLRGFMLRPRLLSLVVYARSPPLGAVVVCATVCRAAAADILHSSACDGNLCVPTQGVHADLLPHLPQEGGAYKVRARRVGFSGHGDDQPSPWGNLPLFAAHQSVLASARTHLEDGCPKDRRPKRASIPARTSNIGASGKLFAIAVQSVVASARTHLDDGCPKDRRPKRASIPARTSYIGDRK